MDAPDQLDRRILYELDLNARQSIADLSRRLKVNRDRIIYRIKKLQDDGVLLGFTAAVNFFKLGLFIYKTYLHLEKNEKRVAELVKHLEQHPQVSWIGETDGKWDVLFSICAQDPARFNQIQEKILLEFSDIILNFSVYTVLDAYCFRKSYLVGLGTDHFYMGGVPGEVQIDDIDYRILRLLCDDCRLTKAEIASQLDLSPGAVKSRIERLEAAKIIAAYPININLAAFGMLFFKAQLRMGAFDQHAQRQVLEYCKTNPYITFFIRQIGDCMIELELEVESYQALHDIMSDIRKKFSPYVSQIDTMFIRKQSYKWVPFTVHSLTAGATPLAANA